MFSFIHNAQCLSICAQTLVSTAWYFTSDLTTRVRTSILNPRLGQVPNIWGITGPLENLMESVYLPGHCTWLSTQLFLGPGRHECLEGEVVRISFLEGQFPTYSASERPMKQTVPHAGGDPGPVVVDRPEFTPHSATHSLCEHRDIPEAHRVTPPPLQNRETIPPTGGSSTAGTE